MTESRARRIIKRAEFIRRHFSVVALISAPPMILSIIGAIIASHFNLELVLLVCLGNFIVQIFLLLVIGMFHDWAEPYYLDVWCLSGEPRLVVLKKGRRLRDTKELARFTSDFPKVVKVKQNVLDLDCRTKVNQQMCLRQYGMDTETMMTVDVVYEVSDLSGYLNYLGRSDFPVDGMMKDLAKKVFEHWQDICLPLSDKAFLKKTELVSSLMVQIDEGGGKVLPFLSLRRCKVSFDTTITKEYQLV